MSVHASIEDGLGRIVPGGLTQRWLIKSVIPAAFVFLIISAAGFVVRNIRIFRGLEAPPEHRIEDDIL